MPNIEFRFAEIRELELELEQSLLALDFAQQRMEPTFAPAARVAAVQMQLDLLRGTVSGNSERRAAWLAHLASLEECQIVHDGPAAGKVTLAAPLPRVSQRSAAGARVEFPVID